MAGLVDGPGHGGLLVAAQGAQVLHHAVLPEKCVQRIGRRQRGAHHLRLVVDRVGHAVGAEGDAVVAAQGAQIDEFAIPEEEGALRRRLLAAALTNDFAFVVHVQREAVTAGTEACAQVTQFFPGPREGVARLRELHEHAADDQARVIDALGKARRPKRIPAGPEIGQHAPAPAERAGAIGVVQNTDHGAVLVDAARTGGASTDFDVGVRGGGGRQTRCRQGSTQAELEPSKSKMLSGGQDHAPVRR